MKKLPTFSRYNTIDDITLVEISKISPETVDAYEEIAEKISCIDDQAKMFYIKENGSLAILIGYNGVNMSFSTLRYILHKDFNDEYKAEMYDVYPLYDYPGGYAILYYDMDRGDNGDYVELVGVKEEDKERILKRFH